MLARKPKLHVDEAVLKTCTGPMPKHVGIIMDGNGRWAKGRGMPRIKGHHEGANAVRRTVESCRYLEIPHLTLYAFSSQNWGRPQDEVTGLMTLFDVYIKKERQRLIDNGVAMRMIGDRSRLSPGLLRAVEGLEDATAHNSDLILQVAVSYGGREEILSAVKAIAKEISDGTLRAEDIDEHTVSDHLYTRNIPDPELIIRTSGEFRVSNFLLWQAAYAEFFVTDTMWPDFNEVHLRDALNSFGSRERRFGLTSAQLSETSEEE
ncbi:isoprenyl transferase [Microvenator marinus]|uniref:Isoprenyl transferase n=1 Tax=Microvenator marinus TaxID=2600177 RepID=A0A5B8XVS7_9DELT|nr:isoprenyl transferase [Microvenator marinus]QED28203.1 isoprenyl transferase [Microvenator marinus]